MKGFDKMIKVAINGFGRIGRLVFRIMEEDSDMEVVAINDLTNPEDLAYLLKYDTSHRRYLPNEITYDEDGIIVKGRKIKIYKEMDPNNLPWKDIDIVFECTGKFTSKDKAMAHINAGAKKVIISAPAFSSTLAIRPFPAAAARISFLLSTQLLRLAITSSLLNLISPPFPSSKETLQESSQQKLRHLCGNQHLSQPLLQEVLMKVHQ